MGQPKLKAVPTERASSVLTTANHTVFGYENEEEAFPKVDPGLVPTGHVGIFQIRHPKRKTKGGIILEQSGRSAEHYNTQIAKVVALGPLTFKSTRSVYGQSGNVVGDQLVEWPEGAWFKPGDYVRVPKYGGDRFTVEFDAIETEIDPETGREEPKTVRDEIVFALFKVKDILGVVINPLAGKAYLD